jgi:hypothetical protein
MSYGIPNTTPNQVLEAAVSRRIASDTLKSTAMAAMYRCLGIGGCFLLLGGGVGLALYGYSYITDTRTSMDKLASAIADALDKVQLKGTMMVNGSVPLDTTDAKVRLDTDGAKVKLDADDATVKLDADGSTVKLNTNGSTFTRPSKQQLDQSATPASHAATVTNFTIFKEVMFADGKVVTGWKFDSSEDKTPEQQYCYYTGETKSNVSIRYDIAIDHKPKTDVKDLPFDLKAAVANCVWFDTTDAPPVAAPDQDSSHKRT